MFGRQVGDRRDRVEVAGVHLTGVGDDDRRPVELGEPPLERLEVEAAGRVAGEPLDIGAAEAEHADRLHGARVDVAAGEDRRRRQAREAELVGVDSLAFGPPAAGRSQADEVRHRRPRGEHAAELGWKLEQLAKPVDRDPLEPHPERRRRPAEGDLVVGRRQPVGRQRRRGAAAHHEVKEPGAARPGRRAVGAGGELGDRGEGAVAVLGHRVAPAGDLSLDPVGEDGVGGQGGEVPARLLGGQLERRDELVALGERIGHAPIFASAYARASERRETG